MIKILVTGGAGFIPSSLVDKLIEDNNYFVVSFDNLITGKIENLPNHPNFKFIKGNANIYSEISEVMLAYQFDYVFHYAALVGVKRTLENPLMVLEDIVGFKNILSLSKSTGVKRIFFSSSSEVYGEPVEFPQNEHTTPLNSKLPYAIVKNVGEAYCKSFYLEHNLPYTIFRFFNTYGPKQSTDFVLSKFIRAALRNEDITIYGDGMQTRTFCYIDDNIDATVKCLQQNLYVNDVINLGSSIETSIFGLAKKVISITNSKSKIVHLPPLKEGDMTRRLPDNKKMLEILNRELTILEVGINNVIASIK
jgi:nucleoside-diphosphate-sugar epimerase